MRQPISLIVLVLGIGVQLAIAANPGLEVYEGLFLVEARVMRIGEQDGYIGGRATVTRCFTKDRDALERTFQVLSHSRPIDFPSVIVYPVLQQEELMLCFVRKNGEKLEHVPGGGYGFRWPVRRAQDPERFKSAQKLARAMARLSQTSSDKERFKVLTESFLSPESSVGTWTGKQLRSSVSIAAAFFREQLNNDNLSVGAKMELDLAFLKLDGKRWQNSAERLKLFQGIVIAENPQTDVFRVFQHLGRITQHPRERGFELEPLVELVRVAVHNERLPVKARSRVASIIGWIPQRYDDDELAFQFAIETVENSEHPTIQKEMARVLIQFFELDRDRRRTVVALMQRLIDGVTGNESSASQKRDG